MLSCLVKSSQNRYFVRTELTPETFFNKLSNQGENLDPEYVRPSDHLWAVIDGLWFNAYLRFGSQKDRYRKFNFGCNGLLLNALIVPAVCAGVNDLGMRKAIRRRLHDSLNLHISLLFTLPSSTRHFRAAQKFWGIDSQTPIWTLAQNMIVCYIWVH